MYHLIIELNKRFYSIIAHLQSIKDDSKTTDNITRSFEDMFDSNYNTSILLK